MVKEWQDTGLPSLVVGQLLYLYSVYLLYWYKSAGHRSARSCRVYRGSTSLFVLSLLDLLVQKYNY